MDSKQIISSLTPAQKDRVVATLKKMGSGAHHWVATCPQGFQALVDKEIAKDKGFDLESLF